jgi:hypothetical protein
MEGTNSVDYQPSSEVHSAALALLIVDKVPKGTG